MKKLVLDTSTDILFVSFLENETVIYLKTQQGRNNHSEHLMEIIQDGLKENQMKMNDFDQIYVGIGPGSYTGLRLALTVAKMIAWTLHKELYVFSSLDVVLSSHLTEDGLYMAKVRAKKGYYYINITQVKEGILSRVVKDSFLEEAKVHALLEKYPTLQVCEAQENIHPLILVQDNVAKKVEDVYGVVPEYLRGEL